MASQGIIQYDFDKICVLLHIKLIKMLFISKNCAENSATVRFQLLYFLLNDHFGNFVVIWHGWKQVYYQVISFVCHIYAANCFARKSICSLE